MSNAPSFPDPYAGPKSHSAHQQDQTQKQLDWLTKCVFVLQEQNRQLYGQVVMLNKAVQQLLNSSANKQHQSGSKEDEEMIKMEEQRETFKGKQNDKGGSAAKKQEKSRKSSKKAAPMQVLFEKTKETSGKGHENATLLKTVPVEKKGNSAIAQNPPSGEMKHNFDGKTASS